jgi:hypothetical protein
MNRSKVRYVLKRVTENDTVQRLAQDFEGNEDYVLSVISFLKEIVWLKEEQNGEYIITEKAHSTSW